MSKEQKRYRQLSIFQSFENSKKSRTDPCSSSEQQNIQQPVIHTQDRKMNSKEIQSVTEQNPQTSDLRRNLHDLLEAAEQGLDLPRVRNIPQTKSRNKNEQASTSLASQIDWRKNEEFEEEVAESSQELFPDSAELFASQPDVEEASSQKSNELIKISQLSCSGKSPDIFDDEEVIEIMDDDTDSDNTEVDMSFLNRKPACSISLPVLEPLENHSIMFSPHIREGNAPRPYPSSFRDRWDCDHVRMPCSGLNRYPVEDSNGEKQIKSRWELIEQSLLRNIESPNELEAAIMTYNCQYIGKWNFNSFHAFFNTCFTEDELTHFFEVILPAMIRMMLSLPKICTQAIPLLQKNKDHYVTMSQKQVACLLLNAFFCTFPRRNTISRKQRWNSEYASYPDINFNRLFYGIQNRILSTSIEKLKCLVNYFRRVIFHEPTGTITFHRQYLQELPNWKNSTRGLQTVVIRSDGLIESEGQGMLQVDFANKFVGGGVLGHGCVQEEIRFIICPELIVSRLFVECLGPSEALIVTGVEQYNKYSGYSDTFKWRGNFQDETLRDSWGRRLTEVVAINATHFTDISQQFKPYYIEKELVKAFCGFYENLSPPNLSAIATGNWGCGAFKGNPTFKFLIQYIAASETRRDLVYFTFGNDALKKELIKIYDLLVEKNLAVGDLWRILQSYSGTVKLSNKEPHPKMYKYLWSIFSNDESSSEEQVVADMTPEITLSDQIALEKLVEAVQNDDSGTDIEESNEGLLNDHG